MKRRASPRGKELLFEPRLPTQMVYGIVQPDELIPHINDRGSKDR